MFAGTRITDVQADIERAGVQLVKGFATIDHVALINVEVLLTPSRLLADASPQIKSKCPADLYMPNMHMP